MTVLRHGGSGPAAVSAELRCGGCGCDLDLEARTCCSDDRRLYGYRIHCDLDAHFGIGVCIVTPNRVL